MLVVFLLTGGIAAPLEAQIAMVANHGSQSVTVFDMSTDTVLGSVPLSGEILDCSLDPQRNLGYVGDFAGDIWAIDISTTPPVLASGTNPIPSSIATEDTAITPDRRFLLSCDGGNLESVSVIDLATRTEVSTFPITNGCQGVEVCGDGSVLIVEYANSINRLTIDSGGNLTDTGEVLPLDAFNVACGKGGHAGVAISVDASITSFTIPGLVPVDTRALSGFDGIAGVVNTSGDVAYVRSVSAVDAFSFDSTTGALGAVPLLTIPTAFAQEFYGVDQLALNPAGTRLYVSEANAINVYSGTSGAFVDSITDASIIEPVGLCAPSSTCGNDVVEPGEDCDDGNLVDGDGCDSNCTITGCGNGIVTAGEECDDGNHNDADCCSNSCTAAPDGSSCDDARFCDGMDTCSAGACTVHTGDPCAGGAECNSVCNEAADNCFAPLFTACTDDGNPCTDDECDGAGSCMHPDNFDFCDDGVFCNGEDFCENGSCSFHEGDPCEFNECDAGCDETTAACIAASSGTVCFDDGNECTSDECDGQGFCVHPPQPSGVSCTNDGNVCTSDQCNGFGECAHPPLASGTPCTSDGNVCTNDQCDGLGACSHPPAPDGTGCDDNNACTQTDQCHSGQCMGGNPIVCPIDLCHKPDTCDPDTGDCSSCPAGYTVGGGGCQKVYGIDASSLDNQIPICDSTGVNRYNDCSGAFGFHWTDTADATVGPVLRVDVQLNDGFDCDFEDHQVSLNDTNIGTYPPAEFCACPPTLVPRTFANVDISTYAKGGANMVDISAEECSGLSRDAQGQYAVVTVTYQSFGPPVAVRDDCRTASKSKLKYRDDNNDANDLLSWKWTYGVATTQADLANPTDSTDYQFCVFGVGSGEPTVLLEAEVPPSASRWHATGHSGYRYKDGAASQGGISRITAKAGADGKARIVVKGRGAALSDPVLPLEPGTSEIRVQLTNSSNGICWESEFPFGTTLVDDHHLTGKAP